MVVATAITACGFVTNAFGYNAETLTGCNSDYRLRFCNFHNQILDGLLKNLVATAITACGFVTIDNKYSKN